jgi:hypothetical protein
MPLTPDPKIETAARQRLRMQRLMLAGARGSPVKRIPVFSGLSPGEDDEQARSREP